MDSLVSKVREVNLQETKIRIIPPPRLGGGKQEISRPIVLCQKWNTTYSTD